MHFLAPRVVTDAQPEVLMAQEQIDAILFPRMHRQRRFCSDFWVPGAGDAICRGPCDLLWLH